MQLSLPEALALPSKILLTCKSRTPLFTATAAQVKNQLPFGFHNDTTELGLTLLYKTLPPLRLSSESRHCFTQFCNTSV